MNIVLLLIFIVSFESLETVEAQETHTYTIYVDPLPDWATSNAANVMGDTITAWHNANPNINFVLTDSPFQQYDFEVQWIKDNTGGQWAGEALLASHIMQVTLGDSMCENTWFPYSRSTLDKIAEHELGHLFGLGHSTDPNNVMNPDGTYFQYGTITQYQQISASHNYFTPICTGFSSNSFSYYVSSSNKNLAFNAYVVPSVQSKIDFNNGKMFESYPSCTQTTQNGWITTPLMTCNNVPSTSGLFIVMKDSPFLSNQLTTLTMQITNITPPPSFYIPQLPITQQAQPQGSYSPSPYQGMIPQDVSVDVNPVVLTDGKHVQLITISGSVGSNQNGEFELTITDENEVKVDDRYLQPSSDHSYQLKIPITSKYHSGQYTVMLSYQGNPQSSTTFEIIDQVTTPEFGPLSDMIVATSIIGVVIISKRFRFHF